MTAGLGCVRPAGLGSIFRRTGAATEASEFLAPRLSGGERLARPFADHAGLKLGDTRHLLQQKPAGCAFIGWHVDEPNLDVCGK